MVKFKSGGVQKHKEKLFKKPKQISKHFKNQLKTQAKVENVKRKTKIQAKHAAVLPKTVQKKKKINKSVDVFLSEKEDLSSDDISDEEMSSDEMSVDENELSEVCEDKNRKDFAGKSAIVGDISESDVDSDDNFSLDESELPVPPDVTTSEDESSTEEDVKKIEKQKIEKQTQQIENDNRTVFVGNLPKSVKKIKLKRWFSKYGTVESVRLRCAPLSDPSVSKKLTIIKKTFHDDRSNIHGFVRFTTVEEATNALAANGQQFDENHHLTVDMASLKGQRKRFDDKKAVFVGNLPFGAEEDQLRDYFADCGDIACIRIVRDKHTSVGKGFAFINFAARHSVRLALEKDGMEMNGRQLRIQKAFYNQEVEIVREQQKRRSEKLLMNKNKNYKSKEKNANTVMKLKKKKKRKNGDEEKEFHGIHSNKGLKRKKVSKKKKKVHKKKEVVRNILNKPGNKEKKK